MYTINTILEKISNKQALDNKELLTLLNFMLDNPIIRDKFYLDINTINSNYILSKKGNE